MTQGWPGRVAVASVELGAVLGYETLDRPAVAGVERCPSFAQLRQPPPALADGFHFGQIDRRELPFDGVRENRLISFFFWFGHRCFAA